MHQHDESSSTDVVYTPGEADKKDGRYMVDNLLLEVLKRWQRDTYFSCVCVLHILSRSECVNPA